ncbi:MAG TPA: hypothetical protein VL501_05485 [Pyrinomonadaceae bacterium]|nr:hypothetical protein [Pyrinomonadaceae bacterium]
MRRTILTTGAIWLLLSALIGTAHAQVKKVSFTSVYTSTGKGCKTFGPPKEAPGTDPAFSCHGLKGYEVYIYYAAAAGFVGVHKWRAGTDEASFTAPCGEFGEKVEWRLADGKPFAVILRIGKYEGDTVNDYELCSKKHSSELLVKGLKGFERIDTTIDGSDARANEKARAAADEMFIKKP